MSLIKSEENSLEESARQGRSCKMSSVDTEVHQDWEEPRESHFQDRPQGHGVWRPGTQWASFHGHVWRSRPRAVCAMWTSVLYFLSPGGPTHVTEVGVAQKQTVPPHVT